MQNFDRAYYTTWFCRVVQGEKCRAFAVESVAENMAVGQANLAANGVVGVDWTRALVAKNWWAGWAAEKHLAEIDLLLVDIQGFEHTLIPEVCEEIRAGRLRVRYIIVGTHSQGKHTRTLDALVNVAGLRVVASLDFADETFFFDGLVVATSVAEADGGLPAVNLGSRKRTPLRSVDAVRDGTDADFPWPGRDWPCPLLLEKYEAVLSD